MTASGVGALAGALYLASRQSVVGLGRVVMYATLAFGVGLIAFALRPDDLLAAVVLPSSAAGSWSQIAATNTVLQTSSRIGCAAA